MTVEQTETLGELRRQCGLFMHVYLTAKQQVVLAELIEPSITEVGWDYHYFAPGRYRYNTSDARKFLEAIEASIAHRVTQELVQ